MLTRSPSLQNGSDGLHYGYGDPFEKIGAGAYHHGINRSGYDFERWDRDRRYYGAVWSAARSLLFRTPHLISIQASSGPENPRYVIP